MANSTSSWFLLTAASVERDKDLSYTQVGAFVRRLRAAGGISARALEFAILTAVRSAEVRGALWSEIDLESETWTIPGDRTKTGRQHRVPLSIAAVALLRALPRWDAMDPVFPAPGGGILSDSALTAVIRRMRSDAVPHSFRSNFRDWANERTKYSREVAEFALARPIGDKVATATEPGDLFDQRRRLMGDWAKFCGQARAPSSAARMGYRKAN